MSSGKYFSLVVLFVLVMVQNVSCDDDKGGRLILKLVEQRNPTGKDSNGDCCAGTEKGNICPTPCVNDLTVCLRWADDGPSADCFLSISAQYAANGIKFPIGSPSFKNPITGFIYRWRYNVTITATIRKDNSSGPLVDEYRGVYARRAAYPDEKNSSFTRFNLVGGRENNATNLVLELSVFCNPDFHDKDCSRFCNTSNCDVAETPCTAAPCQNGGTCVVESSTTYSCKCNASWTGGRCEKAVVDTTCDDITCQNKGRCVMITNSGPTCDCPAQWKGDFCGVDVNECANKPCRNGGTCINDEGGYHCACTHDYEGLRCQKASDPCASRPCKNGGICNIESTAERFSCSCIGRYVNRLCDRRLITGEIYLNGRKSDIDRQMELVYKQLVKLYYERNPELKGCDCVTHEEVTVEDYIDSKGADVTKVTYLLLVKGEPVDIEKIISPTLEEYQTVIDDVRRPNGQPYKVMDQNEFMQLLYRQLHYTINFRGTVYEDDYPKLEKAFLETFLAGNPMFKRCNCVEFDLKQQQVFTDIFGQKVTRLKYILRINKRVINPVNTQEYNLDLNILARFLPDKSMKTWLGAESFLHPDTTLYNVYFNTPIADNDLPKIKKELEQAYVKLDPSLQGKMNVEIVKQEPYITSDGKTISSVQYKVLIDGEPKNPDVPPSEVTRQLDSQMSLYGPTGEYKYTLFNGSLSGSAPKQEQFTIFLKDKVDKDGLAKLKDSLLQAWFTQKPDLPRDKTEVQITNISPYVNNKGDVVYKVGYYVLKDGKRLDGSITYPLDAKHVTQQIKLNGHDIQLVETNINPSEYLNEESLYTMVVDKQLTKEEIDKTKKAIKLAWEKKYPNLGNVNINMLEPQEYTTKDGTAVYKIRYQVTSDVTAVTPKLIPPLPSTTILTHLKKEMPDFAANILPEETVLYPSLSRKHFSLFFKEKVPTGEYTRLENDIKKTIITFKPDLKDKNLKITVKEQEEYLDSDGKPIYRVYYTVDSDDKRLDAINSPDYYKYFKDNMITTGEYTMADGNMLEYRAKKDEFLTYVGSKVTPEDIPKFEEAIKKAWETFKPDMVDRNITIKVNNMKKYVDSDGKEKWKLAYYITENGKVISPISLPKIPQEYIANVVNFVNRAGLSYTVVLNVVNPIDFNDHHQVLFKKHILPNDMPVVEEALAAAWSEKHPGLNDMTVEIVSQEEVLKDNGDALWKAIYFVFSGNYVAKKSSLSQVTDEQLKKKLKVPLNDTTCDMNWDDYFVPNTMTYPYKLHFALNTQKRLPVMIWEMVTDALTTTHSKDIPGVTAKIVTDELYADGTELMYRLLYFIKTKDGELLNPQLQSPTNLTMLKTELADKGVNVQPLSANSTNIRYHQHMSVYVNTKVTTGDFPKFAKAVIANWQEDMDNGDSYKYTFLPQEEYVLSSGESAFKFLYVVLGDLPLDGRQQEVPKIPELQARIDNIPMDLSYAIIPWEDLCVKTMANLKTSYKLVLDSKLEGAELNTMTQALKAYWLTIYPEFKNCSCLDVKMTVVQTGKDSDGKPLYRYLYDIKVNNRDIGTAGYYSMNTDGFSTYLKTVYSEWAINVKPASAFKTNKGHTFTTMITSKTRIKESDYNKVEQSVKQFFTQVNPSLATCYCLTVKVANQTKLPNGEYQISLDGVIMNNKPELLNILVKNLKYQKTCLEPDGKLCPTVVINGNEQFTVYADHKVAEEDKEKFRLALRKAWLSIIPGRYKEGFDVRLKDQESAVDENGNIVWGLSYFLVTKDRQLTPTDVPVMTMKTYNTYLNVKDASGRLYKILSGKVAFPYQYHYGLFFTRPILKVDLGKVETKLQAAWRQWEKDAGHNGSLVEVKVGGQEEYINKEGKSFWKLLYFTKRDGKIFRASDQPTKLITSGLNIPMSHYKTSYSDLLLETRPKGTAPYDYHFFVPLNEVIDPSQHATQGDAFRDTAVQFDTKPSIGTKEELKGEIVSATKFTGKERDIYHQLFRLYKDGVLIYPGDHANLQHLLVYNYFIQNSDPVYNLTTNQKGLQRYDLAFNIFTDRTIPLGDRFRFSKAIQTAMEKKYPGNDDHIVVTLGVDEPFIIPDCKKVWKITAFVTIRGTPLDARSELPLLASQLQPLTKFSILNVMQSSSWKPYNYHMPLYAKGEVDPAHISKLEKALEKTWSQLSSYRTCECISTKICTELFLSEDGKGYVTKLIGFVSDSGEVIDARRYEYLFNVMSVMFWNLVRQQGLKYVESKYIPERTTDVYDVIIKGEATSVDLSKLQDTLSVVWREKLKDPKAKIQLTNLQYYFGVNGERLLRVSYTAQDSKGKQYIPKTTKSPELSTIIKESEDNGLKITYHQGSLGSEKKTLHTIRVDKSLYYKNREALEKALANAWARNTTFKNKKCIKVDSDKCSVTVNILGADTRVAGDDQEIRQLYYEVLVDGKKVPKSYQYVPPSSSYIDAEMKRQVPEIRRWNNEDNKMWSVLLTGQYHSRHLPNLTESLTNAWDKLLGGNVNGLSVNITGLAYSYDDRWGNASRIKYTVTVNGKDVPFEHTPSSAVKLNEALTADGYMIAGGYQKTPQFVYVKGNVGNESLLAVSRAIISSYLATNPGLKEKDISVDSKQLAQQFLNSDSGASLSGLVYTVKVKGSDANPMFVKKPSDSLIHKQVGGAGMETCQPPSCKVEAAGGMMVRGEMNDDKKAEMAAAIVAAYVAANKGLTADDIEARVLSYNNDYVDPEGKDIASVSYAVKRKDGGEVGAWVTPDAEYLAPALLSTGPAETNELYTGPVTAKQTDDGGMSPIWIPILICLAILVLFIILALLFAYYCRRRARNRKPSSGGWGFSNMFGGGSTHSGQYGLATEDGGLNKVQMYELSNGAGTEHHRSSIYQADAAYDAITYDGTLKTQNKKSSTLKSSSSFADRSMNSRWYPGYSRSNAPLVSKHVVVLDYAGANPPATDKLTDGKILYNGTMSYHDGDNEMMVRRQLARHLQEGGGINGGYCLPNTTASDFDFVQVKKKKVKSVDPTYDFDTKGIDAMFSGKDDNVYIRLTRDLEKTAECPADGLKCPVHYIGDGDSSHSYEDQRASVHVSTLSNGNLGGGGGSMSMSGGTLNGATLNNAALNTTTLNSTTMNSGTLTGNGQMIVPTQGEYVETIQTITRTVKGPIGGQMSSQVGGYTTEETTTTTTTSGDMGMGGGAVNEAFIMDEQANFNNAQIQSGSSFNSGQMHSFDSQGDIRRMSAIESHSFDDSSTSMTELLQQSGGSVDYGASLTRNNPMKKMTQTDIIVEEFFEEVDTIETDPVIIETETVTTTTEQVPRQSMLTSGDFQYGNSDGGGMDGEARTQRMSYQNEDGSTTEVITTTTTEQVPGMVSQRQSTLSRGDYQYGIGDGGGLDAEALMRSMSFQNGGGTTTEVITTTEQLPTMSSQRQSTLTRGDYQYGLSDGGGASEAEALMRRMSYQNNGADSVMFKTGGYETQEMSMEVNDPDQFSLIGTLTKRRM